MERTVKRIIFLAVAAALAGCHSRNDDQAGAAPVTGDTTAVIREGDTTAVIREGDTTAVTREGDTTAVTHQIDPERTGPPGNAGRPSGHEINLDSLGIDTSAVKVDTAAQGPPGPTSTPQDTVGPSSIDEAGSVDTTPRDSSVTDSSSAR